MTVPQRNIIHHGKSISQFRTQKSSQTALRFPLQGQDRVHKWGTAAQDHRVWTTAGEFTCVTFGIKLLMGDHVMTNLIDDLRESI